MSVRAPRRSGFSRDASQRRSRLKPLLRVLFVALLAFAGNAFAVKGAIEPLPFKNHAQELRFQHLTGQLRCLVCQNENLADSNADLARDLRLEVFQMMQQGQTDAQIKQFLVARYGDFVLYKPPLKPGTWLLWFGPLAILLAGGAVVAVALQRRRRGEGSGTADNLPAAGTPADEEEDW